MHTPMILYIEDEPLNMRLVKKIVKPMGYDLITREDGRKGIDAARQFVPDLILVDLHLPDIDGFEVVMHLRRDPKTRTLPIIALTADTNKTTMLQCLDAGFDAYLAKPVSRSVLLRTVRQFLNLENATTG